MSMYIFWFLEKYINNRFIPPMPLTKNQELLFASILRVVDLLKLNLNFFYGFNNN